jgi:hypothetical protein
VRRGRLLLAAKSAFGLGLIGALASSVDWRGVGAVLARVSPAPLAALVAVALLMVIVSCWKWRMLLESQGLRLPGRSLLATYFIGYFFTNFLPTGIGGDAVRALRVGQATGRRGASLLAVFFERFTGLVALLTWVVALPLINPAVLRSVPVATIIVAAAVGLALALVAATRGRELYTLGSRFLPNGFVAEKAALIARHFHEFHLGRTVLLRVVSVTVLFYALTFVNVLLGFRAFGIAVSPLDVATYTPVVMFISMIPLSISSLGIAEGAYVYCFLLAGVSREASLSVALIMRLKLVVLGLAGGAIYLFAKGAQPGSAAAVSCAADRE